MRTRSRLAFVVLLASPALAIECGGRLNDGLDGAVESGSSPSYKVALVGHNDQLGIWHSKDQSLVPIVSSALQPGVVGYFTQNGEQMAVRSWTKETTLDGSTSTADVLLLIAPDGSLATIPTPPAIYEFAPRADARRFLVDDLRQAPVHCVAIFDLDHGLGPPLSCHTSSGLYGPSDEIVFARSANAGTAMEIVIMHDDGTGEQVVVAATQNLTSAAVPNLPGLRQPSFSFDGRKIVYVRAVPASADGGQISVEIDVLNRDTQAVRTVLATNDLAVSTPRFTPDGSEIVFTGSALATFNYALEKVNVSTGEVVVLVANLEEVMNTFFLGGSYPISVAPDVP